MSAKPATATADGGEGGATENSEGGTTMALQKKRLRRVSFAEMTSVHFFDRDDEYNEASAEELLARKASGDGNGGNESEEKSDLLGFRELVDSKGEDEDEDEDREYGDGDGDGESEDENIVVMRQPFLRPMESPSPGSTFCSATSNDEDNFFGPVSASFIRSGRLSYSAASDDNHDVTMDSTAFSMHFRSLARSDSGFELKTPTGVHLSFEEKTPIFSNIGNSMEITELKKPISQSSSPTVDASGCSGSSDMSLVGDNPCKYDYGRISPRLDALLAEGVKDFHVVSTSHNIVALISPRNLGSKNFPSKENENGLINIVHNGKIISSVENKLAEANGGSPTSPITCTTSDFTPIISKALVLENLVDNSHSSGNQLSEAKMSPSLADKLSPTGRSMQHESQYVELISSSPAKGRQILTSSSTPTQHMLVVTPQDQRNSFLDDENVKHCDSASSIQKSISKLKLLEASPFSPSLTAKFENSTIPALDILKPSPFRTVLEKGLNAYQIKHLDAPVTGVQGQPSAFSHKQGERMHVSSVVHNQIEDLVGGGLIIDAEESAGAAASPSHLSCSATKRKHDLLSTKGPSEKKLVTAGTDSLLAETALDYVGERKTSGTRTKFAPSTDKDEKKLISSPKLQGQLSNDLLLHNRLMELQKLFPGCGSASRGAISDVNVSTSVGKFDSFSAGRRVHPGSPVVGFSQSDLTKVSATDDICHHDRQGTFEIIENHRTPTKEKGSEFFQPKNLDWNPKKGMDISMLVSDLPWRESEPAASDSLASSVHRNLTALTFRKAVANSNCSFSDRSDAQSIMHQNLVDCFGQTPSKKEVQAFSNDNTSLREVEYVQAPLSNELNSLARKRSNEMILLEDGELGKGATAFQRSPKLQKIRNCDLATIGSPSEDGEEACASAHESKHWKDIYSKFSMETEKLLCYPIDKLNDSLIELLEDVLFNLRRSKTYAMLRNEFFSQKTSFVDDLRQQRVGEARLQLHQIMHEKAKLQLMRVKRQKSLERVQLLSSGLQDSQMLKLNFLPRCKGDAQTGAVGLQILGNLKHRDKVTDDKVTEMKQALDALDKKTASLIKSLTISCKVKGEPSCADIIGLVNELLMKKSCCRFIRLDIQMWVVDDTKSTDGHRDLVLNYLDFIFQSLKLPISPSSSIVMSSKLDDTNITKNFPNMDACTAFSFVFNAESTRKYSGSRSLAEETQVTSSLLGNLVDVVHELQLAQIELRSLTQTGFHRPSVGQLDVHLCFFNFKSGGKVMLTLDLSCLNRGIYPLEILPSQLTTANGAKISLAEPISSAIRDAVKSLKAGYMRILRLCRCVSQVIEASKD